MNHPLLGNSKPSLKFLKSINYAKKKLNKKSVDLSSLKRRNNMNTKMSSQLRTSIPSTEFDFSRDIGAQSKLKKLEESLMRKLGLNKAESPEGLQRNTNQNLNDQLVVSKIEFPNLDAIQVDSLDIDEEESKGEESIEENKSRITHSEYSNSIK